jgi:transposase
MQITTIGLDIAKNVFQVHGIDAAEKVVVRKQLGRSKVDSVFRSVAAMPGWDGKPSSHRFAAPRH